MTRIRFVAYVSHRFEQNGSFSPLVWDLSITDYRISEGSELRMPVL